MSATRPVAEAGVRAGRIGRTAAAGVRRRSNWVQLARFSVVGASGYVVNLAVFAALVSGPMSFLLAAVCSFCVAVANNYTWNRLWTFRNERGAFAYQGLKFLVVSVLALGVNLALLALLVAIGVHEVQAQAVAIVLVTPVNFLGNKLWSFRARDAEIRSGDERAGAGALVSRWPLERALSAALVGFGIFALASAGLVALARFRGWYPVDHVTGAWIALARYVNDGVLYPPLYDGESFGGTRYMPLPILLHAGVARLTGDYLLAGGVVALVMMAALVVVVYVLLRSQDCSRPVSFGLVSTLVVTGTGLGAVTGVRNDALPVILQLTAIGLAGRTRSRWAPAAAGTLCAVALAAKISAVWGVAAIGVWLLWRRRSALPMFATAYLVSVGVLFALFEALSSGRLLDNIGLSFAGSRGFSSPASELSRVNSVVSTLGASRVLIVLAVVAAIGAAARRRTNIYHLAFVAALLVTVRVLADRGTVGNQLLDIQVMATLVVGLLWSEPLVRPARTATARVVVALCVLAVAVQGYVGCLSTLDPRDNARVLLGRVDHPQIRAMLAPYVRTGDRILSENPYVPDVLDQRPVVLDPFMLTTLMKTHPAWRAALVRRLDAREFDEVFLFYRLDLIRSDPDVRYWYENMHFGGAVTAAIARNYRVVGRVADLWLYRPA